MKTTRRETRVVPFRHINIIIEVSVSLLSLTLLLLSLTSLSIKKQHNMATRRLIFDEEEMIPVSPVQQPKAPVAVDVEEDEDERRRREEQESIELARLLMAEEAGQVYQSQLEMIRENPEQLSEEDLAVIRAMEEQDRLEEQREAAAELEGDGEEELSYDALLTLGERIGDVRMERWAMEAQEHIDRLPLETYDASAVEGNEGVAENDSNVKCLVCQHEYQDQDQLRRLPCGHVFHAECVDEWLQTHDDCLYCRKCIVIEDSSDDN